MKEIILKTVTLAIINCFLFSKYKNLIPYTTAHVSKYTIDGSSLDLQLPQPLQHDEAGVGQIRTIKSDNSSLSVKDNILGVAGRCISEQELVAVCKYLTTPFQASFCFDIEYNISL